MQEYSYSLSDMFIIFGIPSPPYLGGRVKISLTSSEQSRILSRIAGMKLSIVAYSSGINL